MRNLLTTKKNTLETSKKYFRIKMIFLNFESNGPHKKKLLFRNHNFVRYQSLPRREKSISFLIQRQLGH